MTPKQQRLWFVACSVVFVCAAVLLMMKAFRENIVFFYTPSELNAQQVEGKRLRIGGLVEAGSTKREGGTTRFRITDGTARLDITYNGILPNLFREGQGVVAEGKLAAPGQFQAERVLAKHDENYMPKDVADKLKASGHWEGENGYGKKP